ncbi:MAG: acyl-CoA thioesterase [Melioribacteraceae bacterium]|nr:acyl-CoA thioesterase [Melioribacteraceae bacterium]
MFIYKSKIKFSECDPAGVVFFANVFKMAHDAYEEFIVEADLGWNLFSDEEVIFPVVSAEAKYFQPLKLHDEVRIQLEVGEIRDSSYSIIYRVIKSENTETVLLKTVHVCIEKENNRKTQLPEDVKFYLSEHIRE